MARPEGIKLTKVVRTPGAGAHRLKLFLENISNKVGKVGYFPSAVYPDGTPVAYVATIQEYGSAEQGIPPRPTMRPTVAKQQKEWKAVASVGAKAMIDGRATGDQVLEAIGLKAAGDIRKAISLIQSPPLQESTVSARLRQRSDKKTVGNLRKPLVDTGLMISSVQNTVEERDV
jgi:hypothetical protein